MNPITLIKYPSAEAFIQAHIQWLLDSLAALEKAGKIAPEFAKSQMEHQAKQNAGLIDKISIFGCCFYPDSEKTTVHGWWDASISDRKLFLHLANELRLLLGTEADPIAFADGLFDLWEQAHTPPQTSHRNSVPS